MVHRALSQSRASTYEAHANTAHAAHKARWVVICLILLAMAVLVALMGAQTPAAPDQIKVRMAVPGHGVYQALFPVQPGTQWSQFNSATPGPTNPPIAGVHCFIKSYQGGIDKIDLRISNGSLMPDGTGFCGKVYFQWMTVEFVTQRSIVVEMARAGDQLDKARQVYWIAKTLPVGQEHVMVPRQMFEREFALAPAGKEARAMLDLNFGQVRIPAVVKNWGPTMSTLPAVDRAAYNTQYMAVAAGARAALATNASYYAENMLDIRPAPSGAYVQPDSEQQAGAVGGYKIDTCHGYGQCVGELQEKRVAHLATIERMPCACFNAKTGAPITTYDWTTPQHPQLTGPGGSGGLELTPFLVGTYNNYQYRTFNPGYVCNYEAWLTAWQRYDVAHWIRYLGNDIDLAERTGDEIYKSDLQAVFEAERTGEWSDRADEKVAPLYPGDYVAQSLTKKLADAQANPHQGGWYERSYAWFMYACAEMEKLYPQRQDYKVVAGKLLSVGVTVADQWGITANGWQDQGYMPAGVSGTQTFHSGLVIHGLFALSMCSHGMVQPDVLSVMERGCTNMYDKMPTLPYYGSVGPPHWIWLAHQGVRYTSLNGSQASPTEGDPAHVVNALALTYRGSHNVRYLKVSLKEWAPSATLAARLAWEKANKDKAWSGEEESVLAGLDTVTLKQGQ